MPRSARRAQLLDAALEVFVAQGYHAAAMDDIAERAGVSKPVLYQHFPGKLELYLALLDISCEAVVADVRTALASTDDNKERVVATMQAFYTYVANDKAAFRLVFESDLTSEPAVRERVERVTAANAAAIATVIRDDTGLPEAQSELLAVSLVGMAQVSEEQVTCPPPVGIETGVTVEVRIGVQNANRELVLDSDQSGDDVATAVEKALTDDSGILVLSDRSGRRVVVPTVSLAYVDISEGTVRKVGFGAIR
jgi:AcrR family transcriptional regulator